MLLVAVVALVPAAARCVAIEALLELLANAVADVVAFPPARVGARGCRKVWEELGVVVFEAKSLFSTFAWTSTTGPQQQAPRISGIELPRFNERIKVSRTKGTDGSSHDRIM